MPRTKSSEGLNIALAFGLCLCACVAQASPNELLSLLPDRVDEFRAESVERVPAKEGGSADVEFNVTSSGERIYRSVGGKRFLVYVAITSSDPSAYSLFTNAVQTNRQMVRGTFSQGAGQCEVGIACILSKDGLAFCKGKIFVSVLSLSKEDKSGGELLALAQLISKPIDAGEKDLPVLVKHLPDWQNTERHVVYAVSLDGLKTALGRPPVLDILNFEGRAEAVTATYDASRLVIIEYTTPQIAADNDARIKNGIEELRSRQQDMPSAYRRVGNYSVFVFGAAGETAANSLIDQVHYEQLVQWLGPNPHAIERAQRLYTETTGNMIVSVVKASGLSLGLCLVVGGIFGAIVFRRRRAQQAVASAYSDAGGMLRLNIDDMVASHEPKRLGTGPKP